MHTNFRPLYVVVTLEQGQDVSPNFNGMSPRAQPVGRCAQDSSCASPSDLARTRVRGSGIVEHSTPLDIMPLTVIRILIGCIGMSVDVGNVRVWRRIIFECVDQANRGKSVSWDFLSLCR